MFWSRYGKSIVAAFMLVVTAVQAALSDDRLTEAEGLQIAVAVCAAITIYIAPNLPKYPWIKTAVAVVSGALEVAVTLIDNGISASDWTAVILGGLTAVMVGAAPAQVHMPRGASTARTGGVTGGLSTTTDTEVRDL